MSKLKRLAIWCTMLAKRYLKNPIIILTILAIPVTVLALKSVTGSDESVVRVAVCTKGEDEISKNVIKALTSEKADVISFYQVDSEEKAKVEVESGNATCAYVFPNNLDKMIEAYVSNNRKVPGFEGYIVKCIQAEETNYTLVTEEMIFASFYEKFATEVLYDFMKEYEPKFDDEGWKIISDYYDSYDIKAEFFRFEYMDGSENKLLMTRQTSFLLLPIRGIILALILLSAMAGGVVAYRDRERGMFQSITLNRRGMLEYLYILVPAMITAVIGLIGIWFSGVWTNLTTEFPCMVLYVFMVTGVSCIIRRIAMDGVRFASVIPVYLLFNLILSPVFIDMTSFVPVAKYAQIILPVSYGLGSLYGIKERVIMLIVGVMAITVQILVNERD